ncbi:methyltransferase domain-containing protein [Streptomyces sp. TRM66268-LWL]|uniref:Methyltransferase domain-containing protein n=1 Tax=Streptomyces polyasparticus TaxID=2767826 RepID=A0ABR7SRD1_9ACTN|nr:class I SAM-dependent methyltransferase [Streptomyces polyasparticus]MBC9717979.1 methyltransferase domain-containing protein [Streptomyces polyasparticus]
MTDLALSFDAVAAQYATARPDYPPELFDTIEELTGAPLTGRRVLDVGAGTGIATRLLRARGARVIAVEPGPGMGAQLHAALPDVPLVRAAGEHLPFADATADLVTYAQSWHWTDPQRSIPEALRVLRPDGALALWWNVPDSPWSAAQEERLATRVPGHHGFGVAVDTERLIATVAPEATRLHRRLNWTRRVTVDAHLAHLGSRSYFAALGPARAEPLLAQERTELLRLFPSGEVQEHYTVELTLAV